MGGSLLLLALGLLAPVWLSAQDKKDDPAKKDDPPVKKKDDTKGKVDPKTDKGKVDPKVKGPPPEKLVYDKIVIAKIKAMNAEKVGDFTIEVIVVDPVKVNDLQVWQNQQGVAIAQAKTPQDRFKLNYNFQLENAKREQNIYSPKDFEVRAVENVKVRTVDAPVDYDDKGFVKQWTPKELAALKGNSNLPGYPSTFEFLKVGQDVQVYLVRGKAAARKLGEPPPPDPPPGVVMIVIAPQPK